METLSELEPERMTQTEKPKMEVKEPVRAFILEYAAARGATEIKDDEPLLTNKLVDSLGSFRLIAFLEENFPLTIEDTDMVPENFHTLNAIETFVHAKLANGAAAN
jgi:acyl carrier protein